MLLIFWVLSTYGFAAAVPGDIQLHPLEILGNEDWGEEERARRVLRKRNLCLIIHCASGKLCPLSWHECGAGHVLGRILDGWKRQSL